jgi:hypothetical protein
VDLLVEAGVSEKRAVSIFKAESLKIKTARFSETSASTS